MSTIAILAGSLIVVAIVVAVFAFQNRSHPQANTAPRLHRIDPPIDGIKCNDGERLSYHQHAKLDIFVNGKRYPVPANVGIPDGYNCLYWIHTHPYVEYPQGVIHMEYPVNPPKPAPTLGRFFHIWEKTRPSFEPVPAAIAKHVSGLHVYVDRKPYHGSLYGLKLKPHQLIAVEIGNPLVPPPHWTWTAGL